MITIWVLFLFLHVETVLKVFKCTYVKSSNLVLKQCIFALLLRLLNSRWERNLLELIKCDLEIVKPTLITKPNLWILLLQLVFSTSNKIIYKWAFSYTSFEFQAVRHVFVPAERKIPKVRIETRQADALMKQRIIVAIDSWARHSRYPSVSTLFRQWLFHTHLTLPRISYVMSMYIIIFR